jgi:hypothetical protein
MSSVPTKRIQIQAIREAWVGARKKILSTLVDLLHGHLDSIWINSSELINKDTLPNAITLNGLSKGVWNKPDHQYQPRDGSLLCFSRKRQIHTSSS